MKKAAILLLGLSLTGCEVSTYSYPKPVYHYNYPYYVAPPPPVYYNPPVYRPYYNPYYRPYRRYYY